MRINPDFSSDSDDNFDPEDNLEVLKHLTKLPPELAKLMAKQSDVFIEMVADLQESTTMSEQEAWNEILTFQGLQINMLQRALIDVQKAVLELSKNIDE